MMTRRGFALAAAPLFAQQKPIRVAMVGTGHGHAASKLKTLRSMPEYEFAGMGESGVHEYDGPERDTTVFRKEKWFAAEVLIDDPAIELIALESSEVDRNLELCERCVAKGKYVHFDKPPGSDFRRLKRIFEEAGKRNRVVQMGYQWRYNPAMQLAMEAAKQGWLGQIYRFRAAIDKLIGPEERKHLAAYKGGMMFSEGCHLIDRATALLGKPRRIERFLHHESPMEDGLNDNNVVILEYPQAIAEISMAGFDHGGSKRRYLEIYGTNGSARVNPYARSVLTVDLRRAAGPYRAGEQSLQPPEPSPAYSPDFSEMAAIIRKGATPTYSAEHDLMTHETLLRACGMFAE